MATAFLGRRIHYAIVLSYLKQHGEIFDERTKFNRVEKFCFSDSQFTWIVHLDKASLVVKIEQICFSGANTGLSE